MVCTKNYKQFPIELERVMNNKPGKIRDQVLEGLDFILQPIPEA